MKTLSIALEDAEYELVNAVKQRWGVSWHDFILKAARGHALKGKGDKKK